MTQDQNNQRSAASDRIAEATRFHRDRVGPLAEPERVKFAVPAPKTVAQLAKEVADEESAKSREENERRARQWHDVSSAMGARYKSCKLSDFEFYGTPEDQARQKAAIESCFDLGRRIMAGETERCGLVLYGPPGTGKDHILAAMLYAACRGGRTVRWLNGLDFFGDMRDRMDNDSPESQIISQLSNPDILAISDPLPPWGPLTAFQAQTLFRVIDRRYRQEKPIWVTVNVADGAEASERIGAAVVDRLRQRALSIHCNWPSYRSLGK